MNSGIPYNGILLDNKTELLVHKTTRENLKNNYVLWNKSDTERVRIVLLSLFIWTFEHR